MCPLTTGTDQSMLQSRTLISLGARALGRTYGVEHLQHLLAEKSCESQLAVGNKTIRVMAFQTSIQVVGGSKTKCNAVNSVCGKNGRACNAGLQPPAQKVLDKPCPTRMVSPARWRSIHGTPHPLHLGTAGPDRCADLHGQAWDLACYMGTHGTDASAVAACRPPAMCTCGSCKQSCEPLHPCHG